MSRQKVGLLAVGAAVVGLAALVYFGYGNGEPGKAGPRGKPGPVASPSFTPVPGSSPVLVQPPPPVVIREPGSTHTVTREPSERPSPTRKPTAKPTPKPSPSPSRCILLICIKSRSLTVSLP